MVVCGSKTYSLGLLEPLLDSIRSEGFTPYVFHGSLPDAPVETVRSGVAYAKEHDVSAIVAFGGGSAMDTAKAIACILDVEGDIVAYCKGLIKPTRRSKLLFAIPTTCGTGSESTDIGVVLDQEENYKYIFSNPFAGPDVAILDPVQMCIRDRHIRQVKLFSPDDDHVNIRGRVGLLSGVGPEQDCLFRMIFFQQG